MRLAGIEKMGYYPTPEAVYRLIAAWLVPAPEQPGRLLDPCCGKGEAAAFLGKALNCQTWGAELSPVRAEEAAQVMDVVHATAWQSCRLTNESVTVLFLNPPYDVETLDGQKRLELEFLRSTTTKLVKDGILIYIIPQRLLEMTDVARMLAGHYQDLRVFRFPDGEFERFKQVVVFARRKQYQSPTAEAIQAVRRLANADLTPLAMPDGRGVYQVLPAPDKGAGERSIKFQRLDWLPEDMVAAARRNGVHTTPEWTGLVRPTDGWMQQMNPAMPLKKGHVAMLMASGMMGTLHLTDEEGRPMLVKGRVTKVVDKIEERDEDKGEKVVRYRDRFVTTVGVLKAGRVKIIDDVEGLTEFMKAHGDKIAAHIMATYRPRYELKPRSEELAVVDRLGKQRKPLPGQAEPGLLPTQKHAAIAAARALRAQGTANIQGEMGLGKTTVAAATIELLDAYPALVICPPHLVPKWLREVQEVIPGVRVRELRRIGRNGDGGDVNAVRSFLEDYDAGKLGHKAIAVVASTSAKFGPGWRPAVVPKKIKGQTVYTCPHCGTVQTEEKDGIVTPVTDPAYFESRRRFCTGMVQGWEMDEEGRRKRDENGNPVWGTRPCGAPLFEYSGRRRWSIAEYIGKHARGRFQMLVADEVHQYKAKSSDRGIAFAQLVGAARRTLTLTGTFFGGKSTSIFWLLHRLNSGVRQDFGFHEEKRWASLYGVLETVEKHKDEDEDGVYTGHRRYRNRAKELPGISPAIVSRLLGNTLFLNLQDLGVALPPYSEEVVILEMTTQQDAQYCEMDSTLKQMGVQEKRYLSTWLQWSLARPNSAFRDETVMVDVVDKEDGKTVRKVPLLPLPAVIGDREWLPKEVWLADFCRAEKAQNRKVLVYVRQTATRDIQPRLKEALETAGLRAAVLHSGIDARKREEWIRKHAYNVDVLITNAKLVETGLDLVDFSTVVFYEIEYSLYTLWQACRRVWRLGQTKPVKVVYAVYENTMEAQALALMGRKMKAAQLLYGDEVGGAIVPEDDGDFLTELAREVLRGAKLPDLKTLFAEEGEVSHSALGCPTATSPRLITWEELAKRMGKQTSSPRRKMHVPDGQLRLFVA